jgi:hypothetical protein
MATSFAFKKAARHAVKLKIGVDGPSGSGKTLGALALAHGITNGGRIAVADSEAGSASLYSDRFDFDAISLDQHDPKIYRELIDAAVEQNYDVLVIDSLSHAWQAVLNAKDDHDRQNPKSNSFANWRLFAPRWEALMQHILQAPIHIIATMRSKQAYEQVEQNGRKAVVKLGLAPQVRDGAEYEFGIVFSVNIAHRAEATKDRTGLYAGELLDLCDERLHAGLRQWMNEGGPSPEPAPMPAASPAKADEDKVWKKRRLGDMTDDELTKLAEQTKDRPLYLELHDSCRNVLSRRHPDAKLNKAIAEEEAFSGALPF